MRCIATLWPHGVCTFVVDADGEARQDRALDDGRRTGGTTEECELIAGPAGPGALIGKKIWWMDDAGRLRTLGTPKGKCVGWAGGGPLFQKGASLTRIDKTGKATSWTLGSESTVGYVCDLPNKELLYVTGSGRATISIGKVGSAPVRVGTAEGEFIEGARAGGCVFLVFGDRDSTVSTIVTMDVATHKCATVLSLPPYVSVCPDPDNPNAVIASYEPNPEWTRLTQLLRVDSKGRSTSLFQLDGSFAVIAGMAPHKLLVMQYAHVGFPHILDLESKRLKRVGGESEFLTLDFVCWPVAK